MNRRFAGALAVLLLCAAVGGCTGRETTSPSVVESEPMDMETGGETAGTPGESSAPVSGSQADRTGTDAPEDEPAAVPSGPQATLYLYRPEENRYFPTKEPLGGEASLAALLDMVAHAVGLPGAVNIGAEQAQGQVRFDFPGDFVDTVMAEEEMELVFLNSLCATVQQNMAGVEQVELLRDGGAYQSAHITMKPGEFYQWPELVLGGGTVGEYAAMRAELPYPGMSEQPVSSLRYDITDLDETGKELTSFLARVGDPGKEVGSVEELGGDYMLARALENVTWYTTVDYGQSETYHPELLPITTAVQDPTVALQEHVAGTVRELFGDVPFEPAELPPWGYHAVEGVYTPPHTSGGSLVQPVIFRCEQQGEELHVELVYLQDAMGVFVDEQGVTVPESELKQTAESRMRRREVVVARTGDGGFAFRSHRYL